MAEEASLDDLWNSAPAWERTFDPAQFERIPEAARRYLEHTIAAGTPLAMAVRLKMHGEIKLKGWLPFTAEQVIRIDRGMIWRAAVRMYGISIRGSDSWLDGHGSMRWRLFGVFPIINASGPDITRSAAGRVNVESIWLPSALCNEGTEWTALGKSHSQTRFTAHGETAEIDYVTDEAGRLQSSICLVGAILEGRGSSWRISVDLWRKKPRSGATQSPLACVPDGILAANASSRKENFSV